MTKALPFQKDSVEAIRAFNGRALLGHEQGLGKSFITGKYLMEVNGFPALIVCPKTLKLHWQREMLTHFQVPSTILSGVQPYRPKVTAGERRVFIINYEILEPWLECLCSMKFDALVEDECHRIGNPNAVCTRCCAELGRRIRKVLALSGTPMMNKPWELFSTLNQLRPDVFDSPFQFGMTYCDGRKSFGKWVFSGARNLKQLHKQMKETCLIRYTKEQVLPQLPPLRRTVIPLEIDLTEYLKIENDFIGWLATQEQGMATRAMRAERFSRMMFLKRRAVEAKMPLVLERLDDLLEETDYKLLVGVWHRDVIQRLYDRYQKRAVVIHGDKTEQQRQQAEDAIRKDPKVRMLIGQIKACGLGLNMPEIRTVPFVELPWNPATCQQFEARPHRLTSKNPVDVLYLIAAGTIEEDLCKLIQKKQKYADQAIDGVDLRELSMTISDELQRLLGERRKVTKK